MSFTLKELYNPLLSECIFKWLLDSGAIHYFRKEKGTSEPKCVLLILYLESLLGTGQSVDLPTSWAQIFSRARAVDFYVFCGKSEQESESSWCWGQLPEPEMRSEGLWESLSPVTVPEVFHKVGLGQFLSCFWSDEWRLGTKAHSHVTERKVTPQNVFS